MCVFVPVSSNLFFIIIFKNHILKDVKDNPEG